MALPRPVAAVAAALATVLAAGSASAQNQDPYFFGDDAALAAGSVVASGRDSGALWYNPAGFGGVQRGSISASASTFGVRIRRVPNAMRLRIAGQDRAVDLASTDILSVPNAVVVAGALSSRITVAGGLLTTARDLRSALAVLPQGVVTDPQTGESATLGERLDLQTDLAKYHFGGAMGVALTEHVRVGFGLFGTYAKTTHIVQYAFSASSASGTDERIFSTGSARLTSTNVGVAASAGVQWDVGRVALGLSVRSPEVVATASAEGGGVETLTAVVTGQPPVANYTERAAPVRDAFGEVVVPARVLAGVAFAVAPSSWVELGVDAAHGLPATSISTARRPVVNGRVGARIMLSPSWVVGGGLFTDHAVDRDLDRAFIGATRADHYGVTAGVSKRTPLALAENPSPEALVLVTTLSLRAGVGFGQARALVVEVPSDPDVVRDDRSDVVFYEVMPYLGSAVVF